MGNEKRLTQQLESLAVRAQAGDKSAYEQFLNLLYPYVGSILKRNLGSMVDVEDLTQECLIGVHKNLATYHPSRPISPWISAIIRYKVADHFRLTAKRNEQALDENVTNKAVGQNYTVGPSPQGAVKLLARLPGRLQRALLLTLIEGMSYAQAAQLEGISEPALRKRISRAYTELRKLVNKNMEFEFDDE